MAELKQDTIPDDNKALTKEDVRQIIIAELTNYSNVMRIKSGQIESGDYVKGSAGWGIIADGSCEFNNGHFRGDITGASGTFGNLHINNPANTIIVNDGTNDRVLIGYLAGKF